MSSEKLVSISWYSTQQAADEEFRQLQEAGLTPSVAGEYSHPEEPVEILVPESQVEVARALLKIPPEGEAPPPDDTAVEPLDFKCPDCRSADTEKVPSYAGRALLVSFVVLGVSSAFGRPAIGFVVVMVGWIAAIGLSRHTGKYRCRSCGREWNPENT